MCNIKKKKKRNLDQNIWKIRQSKSLALRIIQLEKKISVTVMTNVSSSTNLFSPSVFV